MCCRELGCWRVLHWQSWAMTPYFGHRVPNRPRPLRGAPSWWQSPFWLKDSFSNHRPLFCAQLQTPTSTQSYDWRNAFQMKNNLFHFLSLSQLLIPTLIPVLELWLIFKKKIKNKSHHLSLSIPASPPPPLPGPPHSCGSSLLLPVAIAVVPVLLPPPARLNISEKSNPASSRLYDIASPLVCTYPHLLPLGGTRPSAPWNPPL